MFGDRRVGTLVGCLQDPGECESEWTVRTDVGGGLKVPVGALLDGERFHKALGSLTVLAPSRHEELKEKLQSIANAFMWYHVPVVTMNGDRQEVLNAARMLNGAWGALDNMDDYDPAKRGKDCSEW